MNLETAEPSPRLAGVGEGELFQAVGFRLGEEEYGINILEIVGVERLENVLHLPKMPSFISGIRSVTLPVLTSRTHRFPPYRPQPSMKSV